MAATANPDAGKLFLSQTYNCTATSLNGVQSNDIQELTCPVSSPSNADSDERVSSVIPPSSSSSPPQVPVTGISIQAHKLWIGNLDKRLTQ